jgi:transcriptional regulator with XRE-family HTH domain
LAIISVVSGKNAMTELARRVEISIAYLSRIERERARRQIA